MLANYWKNGQLSTRVQGYVIHNQLVEFEIG
jgi:hypothetical protein